MAGLIKTATAKKGKVPESTMGSGFKKPRVLFEWSAPARWFKRENPAWFAALTLTTLPLVVFLFVFVHWSTALLALALAFILFTRHYFEPGQIRYQIQTTGIKIGEERYLFDSLRFFWFKAQAGVKTLHFATYLNYPPYLTLVLAKNIAQEKLEAELLKHLPYHAPNQKDWINSLARLFEGAAALLPPRLVSLHEKLLRRSTSFVASHIQKQAKTG